MKARDGEGLESANQQADAALDVFTHEPATCRADVWLKFRVAIDCLRGGDGPERLAGILQSLKVPKRIDGAWLHALRLRLAVIESYEQDFAANLLRSILVGMAKPRLV